MQAHLYPAAIKESVILFMNTDIYCNFLLLCCNSLVAGFSAAHDFVSLVHYLVDYNYIEVFQCCIFSLDILKTNLGYYYLFFVKLRFVYCWQ